MPQSISPPLNMHFVVDFYGRFPDKAFQSIQGLQVRICKNDDKRGEYAQFENIILKRAYQADSKLVEWCMNAINNHKKEPVDLSIILLNDEHIPLSGWRIERATPVAWGVEELHAQETKILIETIELAYQRFQVMDSKGNLVAPTNNVKGQ